MFTLVLVSVLVGLFSFALGDMLSKEETQSIYMFTTSNARVHAIHSPTNGRYFLMRQVCMKVDQSRDIEWALFTSGGAMTEVSPQTLNLSSPIPEKTQYIFYFELASYVEVTTNASNPMKYKHSNKRIPPSDLCSNCDQNLSINRTIRMHNYYCLSITPASGSATSFQMSGKEDYLTITERQECNDSVRRDGELYHCCNFGFAESLLHSRKHVAYLTARRPNPTLFLFIDANNRIDVYVKYNDPVKTLTAVILALVVVIGTTYFVIVCGFRIKRKEPQPQQ